MCILERCEAGKFRGLTGASQVSHCETCNAGSETDTLAQTGATACTACPAGTATGFAIGGVTEPAKGVACAACDGLGGPPIREFAEGTGNPACVACPDGQVVLDGDPLEALTHMARADVLVAARSQFSYAAIALSQGGVVYPSKWHAHRQSVPRFAEDRVAKCHVPASDSGHVDRDRLAAALRVKGGARAWPIDNTPASW